LGADDTGSTGRDTGNVLVGLKLGGCRDSDGVAVPLLGIALGALETPASRGLLGVFRGGKYISLVTFDGDRLGAV